MPPPNTTSLGEGLRPSPRSRGSPPDFPEDVSLFREAKECGRFATSRPLRGRNGDRRSLSPTRLASGQTRGSPKGSRYGAEIKRELRSRVAFGHSRSVPQPGLGKASGFSSAGGRRALAQRPSEEGE